MTISVSIALLLGVVVAVMLKFGSLRGVGAVIAALFGFYLASTGAAPSVNDFMAEVTTAIEDIGR